ncbi:rhox homeobox family member 1-like [Erethizon dorsatum]
MAAMEEERYDHSPRSFALEFWELEASAGPAPGVPTAAEGGHFSEGAPGPGGDDSPQGHLEDEKDHNPTLEVHVSQGGDTDHHAGRGDQEPEQLPPAKQDPSDARGRQRGRPRERRIQFSFMQWQVQDLESVFQHTQYPDVFARLELARDLNVPESRVKVWFNNRRAKYRKNQRKAMLGNAPPDSQDRVLIDEVEQMF